MDNVLQQIISNSSTVTFNGFPDANGKEQGNQEIFHQPGLPIQQKINVVPSANLPDLLPQLSTTQSSHCSSELSPLQVATLSATTIEPSTTGLESLIQPEPQANLAVDANEWFVQWHDIEKQKYWGLSVPKHKFCKKRSYHETWDEVFYKAPYKYHLKVDIEGRSIDSSKLYAHCELRFENGEQVTSTSKSKKPIIKNSEGKFNDLSDTKIECSFNGLQFNICSYKADNRKFRLVQTIYETGHPSLLGTSLLNGPAKSSARPIVSLVSPVFTIRAKKPVSKPGIKKRKRQSAQHPKEPSRKRFKASDSIPQLIDEISHLSEDKQRLILDQLVERASPILRDYLRLKHFQVPVPMISDFSGVVGIPAHPVSSMCGMNFQQSNQTDMFQCLETLFE